LPNKEQLSGTEMNRVSARDSTPAILTAFDGNERIDFADSAHERRARDCNVM